MSVIRSPLGRARGMGASKHGVGHFIAQRVTAIALVLLVIWGLAAGLSLAHGDYESAAEWLRSPINAGLASLLALADFAKAATKGALLVLNVFVGWLGGALTIICILKVALSAATGVNT